VKIVAKFGLMGRREQGKEIIVKIVAKLYK